ncbi:MAG TPA: PAS domain S-box protein [Actinoplanes sp.]|nr:PAS domain S-box protein [Actinoplanes sp.]
MRTGWRFLAAPLAVWLVLTCVGTGILLWVERTTKQAAVQRYEVRADMAANTVTALVEDLLSRQRAQADAFLTGKVVDARDFTRVVDSFGYPAAVLLDSEGRVLHVTPPNAAITGQRIADRYQHLATALMEGRPAVSVVVPSVAQGKPVVGIAVPFSTRYGLRVFSGAAAVAENSPLSTYLAGAIPLSGVKIHLADSAGAVIAANHAHQDDVSMLGSEEPALSRAMTRAEQGRYREDGEWWDYTSEQIPGTPWRLSASVPENVLYAATADSRAAGRAALVTAAIVGLLVVVATARARRSRLDLGSSEQRFRKMFDNSRIGMALADLEGRFSQVNPAFCTMLGRTELELVGTAFADLTHPEDLPGCLRHIQDCLAGRIDGFDMEKRYLHADGHPVEVLVTANLLHDQAGHPQYFATQIVDVTEPRTLERARRDDATELQRHADHLEHANEQMSDFMAMLSHDVRQPLTTIVSAGEMLVEDWTDMEEETRQHYLRRMTSAGHRAEQLVSEILTLAQLDAGALHARPARVDVAHAARQAVAAQGSADPKNPATVAGPDRVIAYVDPIHLALLLGNLLANAVKYGAPPIQIAVKHDRDRVQVKISDHGEGVPAAFIPHLFERFTRAETGVATTKSGTGLGLYLVARLAEASGATITYQANQPRGAVFVLSLPCSPSPALPTSTKPGTPAIIG